MTPEVLIITNTEQLTEAADDSSLVTQETELSSIFVDRIETLIDPVVETVLAEIATQGPPGPPGPQGPVGNVAGAFMVTSRFSEIAADETAKAQARANLDLQDIDGGTFF